jgi:CRP-like cAMP-binding protein
MPSKKSNAVANRLLGTLPSRSLSDVLAECETVELRFGQVLHETGADLTHAYFPTGGFISLLAPVDDASALEVGMVGSEGMFGIPLALGVDVLPLRAVIQGAGPALRIEAAPFRRELEHNAAFRCAVERYVCVRMCHLAQTAACTRFHQVEARLARWLLMTQDRAEAPCFRVTQEFLAYMLGVRRVGVSRAASALREHGLIRYHRGEITVVNRRGLKAASCSCYQADLDSYDRIVGKQAAAA